MPSPTKVLTLHQPWASLVALGVKTIETRSWQISFRGPLAIHAAKRHPDWAAMKRLVGDDLKGWNAWYAAGLVSDDGATDHIPLGAIVATCTLVDVVPILGHDEDPAPGRDGLWLPHVAETRPLGAGELWHWLGRSENENPSTGRPTWRYSDISGQRSYSDFTPGRFAWLLDKIVPVDPPVSFRGGQRLTRTWEP